MTPEQYHSFEVKREKIQRERVRSERERSFQVGWTPVSEWKHLDSLRRFSELIRL